jgi:hypothetical protein
MGGDVDAVCLLVVCMDAAGAGTDRATHEL